MFFIINLRIKLIKFYKIWTIRFISGQFKKLNISDIIVFTPLKHKDNRGEFFENINLINFKIDTAISFDVVQVNTSISMKNFIRGLHFQKGDCAQSKLIYVEKGSILEVAVDIRVNSKSYGK